MAAPEPGEAAPPQEVGTGGATDARDLLADAPLHPVGYLANASNHTLYCQVGEERLGVHAVYKPRSGERPLWDFPTGTLCQREVAAWVVSDALGWGLVPPTVLRDGPMGVGSVQLFVPHDPRRHYFVLVDDERYHPELARMALFDLLVNNTDRKGSHVLLARADGRLYGIDHGVTFHTEPKLRTVIWELAGWEVEEAWRADLRRLAESLATDRDDLRARLRDLLSARELAVTCTRAEALAGLRRLPDLPADLRPFPWPPL